MAVILPCEICHLIMENQCSFFICFKAEEYIKTQRMGKVDGGRGSAVAAINWSRGIGIKNFRRRLEHTYEALFVNTECYH